MADSYPFESIEKKWQKIWEDKKVFKSEEKPNLKKYYVLEMLPYPSGKLHMGHVRNYSIGDAIARFKKMKAFNVLHPIGWDAFGLPAENAAIKHNIHPEKWTLDNISYMKSQMKKLGFSYDWNREVASCKSAYYRWNQWFFLKMLENGLVYRKNATVNWCSKCQTVLANEQVVNGKCWRDGSNVIQKKLQQWFIKITDYAEELLQGLDTLSDWPERVRIMQKNWIGKSIGACVFFPVEGTNEKIEIFTTRIDTIYGANSVVLSPEHPMVESLLENNPRKSEKLEKVNKIIRKIRVDRTFADSTKEGIFLDKYAVNPFTGESIPIWVANFILMEYGTGAIMAVPGHDERDHEFSMKYNLPIKTVIVPENDTTKNDGELFEGYGYLIDSGPFTGMSSEEAMVKMADYAKENGFGHASVSYRIRDWGISRQRYWGTPIPVVYCKKCGTVPVPENELPIELPPMEHIDYHGGSPLENIPEFVNTKCPECGEEAKRETDTMDTFIDSSWYFLRYADPHNIKFPVSKEKIDYWFPVDIYIGGIEHAVGHLIYMRFWWKMMRDFGLVDGDEPVKKLLTQGMVIKDGAKMSKSLGNIVDPDELTRKYGTDTCRLFILFASPPEKDLDWSDSGIEGSFRFLNRVYRLVNSNKDIFTNTNDFPAISELSSAEYKVVKKAHKTIYRVTRDIEERLQFNTAIAACMELTNELYSFENNGLKNLSEKAVFKKALEILVLLLSPFAPHICEELWAMMGNKELIINTPWPEADNEFLKENSIEIPVMINGKLRDRINISHKAEEAEVKNVALESEKIKRYIQDKKIIKVVYVKNKILNFIIE